MKYSANLTMLFNEVDFLQRFSKARKAGFQYVECAFPYSHDKSTIRDELMSNDLEMTLINAPPGNWDEGERGLSALVNRKNEFRISMDNALAYALALGCSRVHVMAGIVHPCDKGRTMALYKENIAYAAGLFLPYGIDVLLEPLNNEMVPNYLISSHIEMAEIIREIGLKNVKLQFDLFHAQSMHGNLTKTLHATKDVIGYIQVGSVPSRKEPGTEEINFPYFCRQVEDIGYNGFVGLEYHPKQGTEAGFSLIENFSLSP